MPRRGLTAVVSALLALIAPPFAAAAWPGHGSRRPVVRRRAACALPGRSRRLRAWTLVARRGDTIVTQRSNLGEGITTYMGCVRPRGPLRLITTASSDSYSTDDVYGFALNGPYVAYQRLTNRDHYGDTPDVYYVTGFDLATGRQTFSAQSGYVDGTTPSPQPVTRTAFALKTLVVSATGEDAWLSYATSFRTTVTMSTSTSTTPSGTTTTTSTTATRYNPVTTYEITVHDRLGTRTLDYAAQSDASAPLAGLRIENRTVTWLHDGQPRSAELR